MLLPTTSVDQLAWTLAKWFGVAAAEAQLVAPNLAKFTAALGFPPDLGILRAT